jgi:hypothetical protein
MRSCQYGGVNFPRRFCEVVSLVPALAATVYIERQRKRCAAEAVELASHFKHELAPYFQPEILGCARILVAECLPIPDLPFSSVLRHCGLYILNPSSIGAITFDNVIAARQPLSTRLLFHELVHVVQYRLLSIHGFARRYVAGFLSGGSYERIPLERCAFHLEERFVSQPAAFSVEAAVQSWIEENRF